MKRLASIFALTLLLAGCAVTRPQPKIDPAPLDRISFWSWLANQPLVGAAEGYRAMLLVATGEDPGSDFGALQAAVFERDIARPEWNLGPDTAIDAGTAAYMAVQVAKIEGGINLNLWGRTLHLGDRRYALREVAYLDGPVGGRTPGEVITGGQFVALLTWVDELRDVEQAPPLPPPVATTRPEDLPVGRPPAP